MYILICAKYKWKPQSHFISNYISRGGEFYLVFFKRRFNPLNQQKDLGRRFMLSGFRSSFLSRLSPPAGKGRAAHHLLEALWGTQVEARYIPIGDGGCGFSSPYYYWEYSVTRSKMLPTFVPIFLAFLLFQWKRFSASLTSHSIDFWSRSHFFSPSKLLWLQLSSQSSPACCPISLRLYWSKVLKRNVYFSMFSSFIHTLTHI